MATENIVKNRFYRILSSASEQIWDRISFWNTAEDTEATDGNSLEYKVGAINGITDALDSEDSSIAASSVAVKTLNDSLTGFPNFSNVEELNLTSNDTTIEIEENCYLHAMTRRMVDVGDNIFVSVDDVNVYINSNNTYSSIVVPLKKGSKLKITFSNSYSNFFQPACRIVKLFN